jgi:hypothetical protein
VAEQVVQVAGEPQPLLVDRCLGELVLGAAQLVVGTRQAADQQEQEADAALR